MGNCKSCVKSKTSDDIERSSESRHSVRGHGEGQRSSQTSLRVRGQGAEDRPSSRVSLRSASKRSENEARRADSTGPNATERRTHRPASSASKVFPASQPPSSVVRIDDVAQTARVVNVPDFGPRSSSRTSHRRPSSGSAQNKANVIHVRPAGDEARDDDGKQTMEQVAQKYGAIRNWKDMCQVLWKESHHLTRYTDYEFSRKYGLQCKFGDRFFATHPTYSAFRSLLMLYGEEAMYGNARQMAEERLLDEVLRTNVMRICWAFLRQNRQCGVEWKDFKDVLRLIWFHSSAFRHIFVGDFDDGYGQVSGLHNWLQYHLERQKGSINYESCKYQIPEVMVAIKYQWNGVSKDCGSMFIGTSPEFELALYTMLYFQSLGDRREENDFACRFDGSQSKSSSSQSSVKVKVVIRIQDKTLKTAYPMKPRSNENFA